ncbi:hypothetical protein SAICODRAFT_25944 [Saitoella complicata NRRL Y-17804]|nr:uncharacterized protein SAICODRAFT_25944 [Saitoella complicata NRRL Y-17804]ODQ52252.1 hypothetical protein SAICODRAFT_25944 [Saitoella complicata NRRL Y-17804]
MDGSPMFNGSPHVSQMQPPQGPYPQPPSMSMVQQQQQLQLMQAQQQAAAAPADSDKILRLFIRDYLAAHNFHSTAAALTKEAELPGPAPRPPQDAQQPPPPTTQQVCAQLGIQLPALPAGGLEEWWHIFNEIFSAVRGDQKSGVVVDMVRAQNERMTQRSQAQKATVVPNMNGMTQLAMNMNPMAAAAAAAAAAVQQPALQIQLQPAAQIAPGPGPGPRPMAPPQQPLLTPNTFATNAHLMSQSIHALGLAGRDPKTFTQEERQRIMERTMRTQQQSVQAQQAQQMSMQQQQQLGQQQRVQLHQQHQQQMQHQAAQAQMAQLQQQQLALQHHQQQIQHALQQQALQQGGGAHGQGGLSGMGVDLKTTNQQLAELQARQAAVLRRQQEQLKRRLSVAPQSAETSPAASGPPAPGQGQGQGQGQVAPSPVVGNMPGPGPGQGQGGNVGGGAGQNNGTDSNTASGNGSGDGNEQGNNNRSPNAQQNNQPQPPTDTNSNDSQATQNQNPNPFAMEWPNADSTDAPAFDASDLFDFGDNDNEEGQNSGDVSNGAQVTSADWNAGLPTGMITGDSFGGFDFGDMGGDINFENFA